MCFHKINFKDSIFTQFEELLPSTAQRASLMILNQAGPKNAMLVQTDSARTTRDTTGSVLVIV